MKLQVLPAVLICALFGQASHAKTVKTLQPGDAAPSFSLQDYRGTPWTLSSLKDKQLVVVTFLGTECPLVRHYAARLQQLSEQFAARGVEFVGIDANQQDSLSELAHFAKETKLRFPLLKDAGNVVADQFGAERTPEVFVLDAERRVRYHGRIDDQFTYGVQKQTSVERPLVDALEALLAGRPVQKTQTEIVGCHIGRLLTPQQDSPVTYSKQISRILNQRCVECHRSGEIGPFSLTNYTETVGWAEMIAEVVRERRMPPWHADPAHGRFINDARLSDEERTAIQQWVDAGAPEGNAADLPPAPKFVEGWRIGTPDLVIPMADKPFSVPASGEVRYQYFAVDPGFKEDKWVQAAECRIGNRAVVHHIIVAAGSRERVTQRLGGEVASDWLAATAPGSRPMILPKGLAKRIPAGAKIIFQMHYTPNGTAQQDLSSIGLIFAKPADVKREVITQKAANTNFRIPPGDSNYQVEANYRFEEDAAMLALFPHMHLRGKAFRYTAHYPDGREETLLNVPRYDFNWQNAYAFAEPKPMPAGTRIHCVAHFDNSKDNWANPDPTKTVKWGDQTWEEMMIGYFDMTPIREVSLRSRPTENRVAKFAEQVKKGPVQIPGELLQQTKDAQKSAAAWQSFGRALRLLVPQLDRVCWISVDEGKMKVERVHQAVPGRRNGGEGTVVPVGQLFLAKYATSPDIVVHADISKLNSADFRLLANLYSSSVHVPIKLEGKPGIISFWSSDPDAFSPAAVDVLRQVAAELGK